VRPGAFAGTREYSASRTHCGVGTGDGVGGALVGEGGALVGEGGALEGGGAVGEGGAAVGDGPGLPSQTQNSGGQLGGMKLQFELHHSSLTTGEMALHVCAAVAATNGTEAKEATMERIFVFMIWKRRDYGVVLRCAVLRCAVLRCAVIVSACLCCVVMLCERKKKDKGYTYTI
jgi:hypothetical protein